MNFSDCKNIAINNQQIVRLSAGTAILWEKKKTEDDNLYFLTATNSSYQDKYPKFKFKYYWNTGYKMRVTMYMSSSSALWAIIGTDGKAPIEFTRLSSGFYLDFHAPNSTQTNSCSTSDYTKRQMNTNIASYFKQDGTILDVDIMINKVTIYNHETGALIKEYGSVLSGYNYFNGLYEGNIEINRLNYIHRVQVFDGSGNVVNDCVADVVDGTPCFHDNILDATYYNDNDAQVIVINKKS